jgi:heme o synthase
MTKASTSITKPDLIKTYYRLTKPGIIYGNCFTAVAGFFLASQGHIKLGLLIATLAGLSLIIASACVFNNYFDRQLDAKMARTKSRAMVTGAVSGRAALIYGLILLIGGIFLLADYVNGLALTVALSGWLIYVFLYTFGKRRTVHGTIIGSFAGAVPPVVGYTAVTGHLDGAAILLFLILVFWQMPHFYSIAIYRSEDYAEAKIPVLPLVSGIKAAKIQILGYIAAFLVASALLYAYGYTGYVYLAVVILLGAVWIRLFGQNNRIDDRPWARKMFFFSLVVITLWSLAVSFSAWLP